MSTLADIALQPSEPPVRPPYDPEIQASLDAMEIPNLGPETLQAIREFGDTLPRPDLTADGEVIVSERAAPGRDGAPDVRLTVLTPAARRDGPLPVIYYVHGGAFLMGNRYMYLDTLLPFVTRGDAVVVSVGYRFAPEHPAPAQLVDCFTGLNWVVENAAELGIDPEQVVVMGVSAGGAIALGMTLLARDQGSPAIKEQVLVAPALDDRFLQPSTRMLPGESTGVEDCVFMWDCALGDARGGPNVSPYLAPARATDLTRLPRTYLDTGSAESFRDDILSLAMRLSQAGVLVDLHMGGGGCHGYYYQAPDAAISKAATAHRESFLRRALGAESAS